MQISWLGLKPFVGVVDASLEICQANCVSSDRLVGPTRMTGTREHPWKIAQFPSKFDSFCKLGCQYYFSEVPKNVSCKNTCEYVYRYGMTVAYSDVIQMSILECRDGCDIANLVCQKGFYCTGGEMLPCPAGTYNPEVADLSIVALEGAATCDKCPQGRYRSATKGVSIDSCTKCPIGKYAAVTGSVLVSDCKRCPAGKVAQEEGMSECKCITAQSCNLEILSNGIPHYLQPPAIVAVDYFANGEDYFRESIPYIGRS